MAKQTIDKLRTARFSYFDKVLAPAFMLVSHVLARQENAKGTVIGQLF
jgi:hypothetical protein